MTHWKFWKSKKASEPISPTNSKRTFPAAALKLGQDSKITEQTLLALGQKALASGDAASAELHFIQALDLNSEFVPALAELADLWKYTNPEGAEGAFRHLLTIDPNHELAQHGLASLLAMQGEQAEAEALYKRVLSSNQNVTTMTALAMLLSQNELRRAESEQWFRLAVATAPDHCFVHYNLAVFLQLWTTKLAQAEASYRRSIELDPGSALSFFGLASLSTMRRNPTESEALLRRALAIDPNLVPALCELSMQLVSKRRAGDGSVDMKFIREAEGLLRRALAQEPACVPALFHLGELQLRYLGDHALAERFFDQVRVRVRARAPAHRTLAPLAKRFFDLVRQPACHVPHHSSAPPPPHTRALP